MTDFSGASPEAGRLYDCYDDGKCVWDRHYIVRVIGPVRLADLPPRRRREVERCLDDYDFLYDDVWNQDVLWDSVVMNGQGTKPLRGSPHELFVRARCCDWFGIGSYWSGQLDVSGDITRANEREFPPLLCDEVAACGGLHTVRHVQDD